MTTIQESLADIIRGLENFRQNEGPYPAEAIRASLPPTSNNPSLDFTPGSLAVAMKPGLFWCTLIFCSIGLYSLVVFLFGDYFFDRSNHEFSRDFSRSVTDFRADIHALGEPARQAAKKMEVVENSKP